MNAAGESLGSPRQQSPAHRAGQQKPPGSALTIDDPFDDAQYLGCFLELVNHDESRRHERRRHILAEHRKRLLVVEIEHDSVALRDEPLQQC